MASDMLFQVVVVSISIEQVSHENTRSGNVIGRRVQSDFRGFRRAWGFFFQIFTCAYLFVFQVSELGIIWIAEAKAAGASEEQLQASLDLQRKAQWRLDFIAAENSMGFHAPQEAARILGEAADYARQGQVAAINWNK